eukprot:4626204-Pleurochrysis_carterae.AAC.1
MCCSAEGLPANGPYRADARLESKFISVEVRGVHNTSASLPAMAFVHKNGRCTYGGGKLAGGRSSPRNSLSLSLRMSSAWPFVSPEASIDRATLEASEMQSSCTHAELEAAASRKTA